MARKLTDKQRLFIDAYISNGCNGTRAAEAAQYAGGEEVWASVAYENLRKPQIRAEIDARLAEFMTADEVLYRLTEIARADIGDALDDSGNPDIRTARQMKQTRHIKRVKQKTIITADEGGQGSDIHETEIEMYDKLAALKMLGQAHGLFVERVQVHDWRSEVIDLVKAGKITQDDVRQELGEEIAQELFVRGRVSSAAE